MLYKFRAIFDDLTTLDVDAPPKRKTTMTPTEMNAALAVASARAEPIIPDGWQVPNGYTLRGPRGRKRAIGVDANGNVNDFDVEFFVECVADSDARAYCRRKI